MLPPSEEITALSDAVKLCIENEPYVTPIISDTFKEAIQKLEEHQDKVVYEAICLSDDPITIDKYFKCFLITKEATAIKLTI